jgi:secreted PhoX family phosphatase
MNASEVSTHAGECGANNFGFKDGPLGINRFNKPDGIGIDDDGNLFVYDSGNNYMRMIRPDGYVVTFINGACFEYGMIPFVENIHKVKNEYVICFKYFYINNNLEIGLRCLVSLMSIFLLT